MESATEQAVNSIRFSLPEEEGTIHEVETEVSNEKYAEEEMSEEDLSSATRHDWSDKDIKKLISTVCSYKEDFLHKRNHKQIWRKVASTMNIRVEKCKHKWMYLKKAYRKYWQNWHEGGPSSLRFKYAEQMHDIMQDDPMLSPPAHSVPSLLQRAMTAPGTSAELAPTSITIRALQPLLCSSKDSLSLSNSISSNIVPNQKKRSNDEIISYLEERDKRIMAFQQKIHDDNKALLQQLIKKLSKRKAEADAEKNVKRR